MSESREAFCRLQGAWNWEASPLWYEKFHYSEEIARGYEGTENLYSAGILSIELHPGESGNWGISRDSDDLSSELIEDHYPEPKVPGEHDSTHRKPHSRVSDFILSRPAGLVAGFPWFGEWGRDTFISLPGIVVGRIKNGEDPVQIWQWAHELLRRWGNWIEKAGMIPNVLGEKGKTQWESSDATLWWCHSLSVLWGLSLSTPYLFMEVKAEFGSLLSLAIHSIREGRHSHLTENSHGLLEVTTPHSTWMDAVVQGAPVTPRLGVLPEINALWFQARCLQWLWTENGGDSTLETIGRLVLEIQEPERPNQIFIHSLCLAPSVVLKDWDRLERDLISIAQKFWTPVGLRTLDPTSSKFRPHCVGDQAQRDQCYHQGAAWAWLGGHFEIARQRLFSHGSPQIYTALPSGEGFPVEMLREVPIEGHIPELFDADPPYAPRGSPAQAWSLACLEEARAHQRMRTDSKISKILAQRWLGRKERSRKVKKSSPDLETKT